MVYEKHLAMGCHFRKVLNCTKPTGGIGIAFLLYPEKLGYLYLINLSELKIDLCISLFYFQLAIKSRAVDVAQGVYQAYDAILRS